MTTTLSPERIVFDPSTVESKAIQSESDREAGVVLWLAELDDAAALIDLENRLRPVSRFWAPQNRFYATSRFYAMNNRFYFSAN